MEMGNLAPGRGWARKCVPVTARASRVQPRRLVRRVHSVLTPHSQLYQLRIVHFNLQSELGSIFLHEIEV